MPIIGKILVLAVFMRGLYLITNDDPIELLLAKLEGAMATYEVAVLQYRRKNVPQAQQAYEIEYMKSMCDQYKVPFVINDDLETAVKYGVGVHLGQEDGSIVEAVARLPQDVLIGRSCNNSIELAKQAIADGAGHFQIDTIDVHEPQGDEIRVLLKAAGVCHTDWDSPSWGKTLVMGHEGAGIVQSVGPLVTRFRVGAKIFR